ncbi:MAG: GGDEF domain-containing protein [Clostridiales bacterium]|nr:GGDEF domain-containing protein [Clostridiales bacterium]
MKFILKQDGELLKVFVRVALAVLFCALALVFLEYQIQRMERGLIDSCVRDNEYIVKTVADEIRADALSEEDVGSIVRNAPATGTRYWMLFSEQGPLFERNADTTSMIAGNSYTELENYYLRQGGSGVSAFIELIQNGEFFSAVVTKDVTLGNEIISADYVEINGQRYCVCTSVLQSFLFSSARIGERAMMLRVLVIAFCALLVTTVALLGSSVRSKTMIIRKLRDELIEKNLLIHNDIGSGGKGIDAHKEATYDSQTGLHALGFYEAFMMKLTQRRVSPIGFIVVRISNYYDMVTEKGADYADKAVRKTAAILLMHTDDTDMAARLSVNEFALVKLRTTEKLTIQSAKRFFRELGETDTEAKYSAGFAYRDGDSPVDAVIQAALNSVKPV